jgi:flagellar basal-body rod protein FlgC
MSLLDSFKVAGSGMMSQSQRLNAVSSNMANADTAASSEDRVYQSRKVIFEAKLKRAMGSGARVAESVDVASVATDKSPARRIYDPKHPLANGEGYVFMPNVNMAEEMVDMMAASRSYQTNAEIMNTSKQLMLKTLNMGNN